MQIPVVKPKSHSYHYSNPDCQGSLMNQTANWPMKQPQHSKGIISGFDGSCHWHKDEDDEPEKQEPMDVPEGMVYDAVYEDRMQQHNYEKHQRARIKVGNWQSASNGLLIAFAKEWWERNIKAVRITYYFNVATGFDCPVIEVLYKE